MALNIARLALAIQTAMEVAYRVPSGDANDENAFLAAQSLALATAIINEITGHAQCSGTDSGGDSHTSVGII
jgi:hypothetical protein